MLLTVTLKTLLPVPAVVGIQVHDSPLPGVKPGKALSDSASSSAFGIGEEVVDWVATMPIARADCCSPRKLCYNIT